MKDKKSSEENHDPGNQIKPSKSRKEPGSAAKMFSRDITPVLQGWEYEPGTFNVRKVSGLDGTPKLQMRLDLGLLQMEMSGRPDGGRPHGRESLLDYFQERLDEYKNLHGTEEGFHLTGEQCQVLREEAVMYYQRYLSLSVLEEFPGVVRDTARNLRVLDFCSRYAVDEQDRLILEQYRPYITMMNCRAQALIELQSKRFGQAMKVVEEGLERIREFYEQFGQEEVFAQSNEVKVLKRLLKEIHKKLPVDPMERLRRRLNRAVKEERYEEAAQVRDQIEARQRQAEKSKSDKSGEPL